MLISSAYAASGASTQDLVSGIGPFVIIFVLFFFMIIRPQMKQAKETKAMIDALQKGDEVVTTGGIVGRVAKVSNDFIVLEITDSVSINVQKHAVQTLLPKGTIKAI